jgi:hypothetical protein
MHDLVRTDLMLLVFTCMNCVRCVAPRKEISHVACRAASLVMLPESIVRTGSRMHQTFPLSKIILRSSSKHPAAFRGDM